MQMLPIENLHATVAKPMLEGLGLSMNAGEELEAAPDAFAAEAQKLLGISLKGSVG